MLRKKEASKRFIIRRLDKMTGIRHTIVIYSKDGMLHTTTKENLTNVQDYGKICGKR